MQICIWMFFTVHDINLMDCKRMFRKEQIWFVHKDEEGGISLSDYLSNDKLNSMLYK